MGSSGNLLHGDGSVYSANVASGKAWYTGRPQQQRQAQQQRGPPASPQQMARLEATCAALLDEGRPEAAAAALRRHADLTGEGLADAGLGARLISGLVAATRAEQALELLPLLAPAPQVALAALRACGAKRSLRGLSAAMEQARRWGLLRGRGARPLWLECIKAQGKLGAVDAARRAFRDMRAAGACAPDDTPAASIFLHAIHSDVRLTFVRARQLLDGGLRPDTSLLNVLLKACMRAADGRRAELALAWMAPYGTHSYAGDLDRVLRVRALMDAAGYEPSADVWGALVVACGAAREVEMAGILWWEARQRLPPGCQDLGLFHAMMTACVDNHQGERALDVFHEARAAGLALQPRSWNLALKACEALPGKALRREQLLQALALLEEMRASGAAPDAVTYGTLLELCAQARQGRAALQLHAAMRAEGVRDNVVLLTSLIKALGASGMAAECLAVWRRMVYGPAAVRPNRAAHRALIAALRQAGELGAALRAYELMRRHGFAPNDAEFSELTAAAAEAALAADAGSTLPGQVAAACNVTDPRMVDLHGMSAQEARAAVLCVLALVQQAYRDSGDVAHDVTVITGRGQHSEGGAPVLRGAVIRLLEDELRLRPLRLECGVAAASSRDSTGAADGEGGGNAGRVVIPRQTLLANCRAKCLTKALRPRAPAADGQPPRNSL